MTGTQHIPGTQHRCGQAGTGNGRFGRDARRDVRLHDGRRMRNADIDEVWDSPCRRGGDRRQRRRKVDRLKLGRFRWARVGRAHEVHERGVTRQRR